jgi:ArsR family transcriptional regulator
MIVDMTSEQHDGAGAALPSCCGSVGGDALSEREAADLADALKALADPIRLRLVSIVATAPTGEVCACDLPAAVERSQPTVSHHLSLLVDAGVLEREQRGKWAWFRLRPERLDELSGVLSPSTRSDRPAN